MFKKKVKEPTVFEETTNTLLESIKETAEAVNYDPEEKQVEALATMAKAYADIVKSEAEMQKQIDAKNAERNKNIIAIATTCVTSAVTVGLTLVTFGYETSGNGNFFTTVGRQTIGNVLKSIKK